MKKLTTCVVLTGLFAGCVFYGEFRIERLAARVAYLERLNAPQNEEGQQIGVTRIDRLEQRLAAVERMLDERPLRSRLDSDLKSIRDLPDSRVSY